MRMVAPWPTPHRVVCAGDKTKPALGSGYKYFGVPLANIAVTQTVTNTFLELVGVRDKIKVASPLSTSACLAKRVSDGSAAAYIKHSDDEEAHAAQMGDVAIEAIFSDPWYTSKWEHAPSAPKVICEASTYET